MKKIGLRVSARVECLLVVEKNGTVWVESNGMGTL